MLLSLPQSLVIFSRCNLEFTQSLLNFGTSMVKRTRRSLFLVIVAGLPRGQAQLVILTGAGGCLKFAKHHGLQ